jgi:hypothetical protein
VSRAWFELQFPYLLEAGQLEAWLRQLHGMSTPGRRDAWIVQAVSDQSGIRHQVGLVPERAKAVQAQAEACMPGALLVPLATAPSLAATANGGPLRAWRLWLSTSRRPLRLEDPEATSRGLLTALAQVRGGERLVVQWWLGPVRRPVVVPNTPSASLGESWAYALATAAVLGPKALDSEARRALRLKQGQPGWRAVGRIAVAGATQERSRFLLGLVAGAFRAAEAPGVALGVRRISPEIISKYRKPWRWTFAASITEFSALLAWPLNDVGQLPVQRRAARLLPVPRGVPSRGLVVAVEPLRQRPLAISSRDLRQHLHLVGPTGVGKSTVLLNLVVQALEARQAVVVIEPKGDLVADVLARIPLRRRDDVVLLDATAAAPVGLNPLYTRTPELAADQLLHIFASTYPDSWGPRLADILHAALLTLARTPGASLPLLPVLLTNGRYRRQVLSGSHDPFGVGPFWAWFENLSATERQAVVAPVINKIRPLSVRPDLRAVLGQARPRFSLAQIFTERKVLLVDLSKGRLGPSSSQLLGSLLVHQLWQQTLARVNVAADKRHPVLVVVDEVQDYLGLPVGIGEILSQSRGLGVAWALAHQHLGQLPLDVRAAMLANARSRVVFQASAEDATVLSRGHDEIRPEDFTRLPAFEAYLRLSVGSEVTRYMSGATLPPPDARSDAKALRQASAERYGRPRMDTDRHLQQAADGPEPGRRPSIGSRRTSG